MRRLTLIFPCVLALLALAPASASASRGMSVMFDATDALRSDDRRAGALRDLQSLGVRELRVLLYWKRVAPAGGSSQKPSFDETDPGAYDWGGYDALMAAARERGWNVVLTPTGPVPVWATRDRKDDRTRPSPRAFERFMTAVARRYGDQVSTWAVWNEPNHPKFLLPQYAKGRRAASPRIYRQLVQAADRALDATGNAGDTLLAGETAPIGTGKVVTPLRFLRGTLCLTSRYRRSSRGCGRLDVDGWAHHPYTRPAGPYFRPSNPDDVTIGTLSRLTRALDRAARAGAVRRRLPVHLTEFGVQSTPDRYLGVSLAKQVEHRAAAERIAWSNGRVKSFSQYLLFDDQPDSSKVGPGRYPGFESGLRFATGHAKPAFQGFRLTLSALRSGSRVRLWGRVRPASGRTRAAVYYARKGSRKFRRLKGVGTDRFGVFTSRTRYVEGRRYQLRWSGRTGAPVRAFTPRR